MLHNAICLTTRSATANNMSIRMYLWSPCKVWLLLFQVSCHPESHWKKFLKKEWKSGPRYDRYDVWSVQSARPMLRCHQTAVWEDSIVKRCACHWNPTWNVGY